MTDEIIAAIQAEIEAAQRRYAFRVRELEY
jgi:hypothetical protein